MDSVNTQMLTRQDQDLAMPERVIMMIMDAARDKSIDIDKLERLLAMQQQMVQDQRKMDFDDAMQRLQAKMPQVGKYGKGKNSKFAKYEDMDTIIRPLLAEEKFSISFSEEGTGDGKVRFALEVSRAGHSKFYYRTITVDSAAQNREGKSIRPAIQDDGSTTSYARRYLLKMALNIVETGEDTDGDKSEAINGQEVATILQLIKETKSNEAEFLKYMNVSAVSDIQVRNYKTAINALETKKRNMAKVSPAGKAAETTGETVSRSEASTVPAGERSPVHETKPGVVEPDGQPPLVASIEDIKAWFTKIETSGNEDTLKAVGLGYPSGLSDEDAKTGRALYAARLKQLRTKPVDPTPVIEEPFI